MRVDVAAAVSTGSAPATVDDPPPSIAGVPLSSAAPPALGPVATGGAPPSNTRTGDGVCGIDPVICSGEPIGPTAGMGSGIGAGIACKPPTGAGIPGTCMAEGAAGWIAVCGVAGAVFGARLELSDTNVAQPRTSAI